MGCANPRQWVHHQLVPTGLDEWDQYFDEVQENINWFDSLIDLAVYAKDQFMFEVDMDIFEFATTRHATMGLMYSIAARCRNQGQFEAVFEPKLAPPYVYFNQADLGPEMARRCMSLRELIKVVVETHNAMNTCIGKFREYSNKVQTVNNEVNA